MGKSITQYLIYYELGVVLFINDAYIILKEGDLMFSEETNYNEYKHIITKAYEISDHEAIKRLSYVKKNVPIDIYNRFLLETLQWQICILSSKRLDNTDGNLELICSVLKEIMGRLENETNLEVPQYAVGNF